MNNYRMRRRRYTHLHYDISILLYLTIDKTYDILRQLFPPPSKQSFYTKFGLELSEAKSNLIDLSKLPFTLHNYREIYSILYIPSDKYTLLTLGIDAFSFRSFVSCGMTSLKYIMLMKALLLRWKK